MKPIEIVQSALAEELINEDGESWGISLLPGVDSEYLVAFEEKIGFELPSETRELVTFTNGILGGPLEGLEFIPSGFDPTRNRKNEFGELCIEFAADGFGNHWSYLLNKESVDLGPIYFFCHDPALFLYQSPDLTHFLGELLQMCRAPFKSLIDDVHEDRLSNVWIDNPGLIPVVKARSLPDESMAEFAQTLPNHWMVKDLRKPEIGDGFSFGRCRSFQRHPKEMIFGLDFKEPGRLSQWLGKIGKREAG